MQFHSRSRIGINRSRCVWVSGIYKYRNIVPIWGKKSFFTLDLRTVQLRALAGTEKVRRHSQDASSFRATSSDRCSYLGEPLYLWQQWYTLGSWGQVVNEVSSQTEGFLIYLGFSLLGKQAMSYSNVLSSKHRQDLGFKSILHHR